MTAFVCCGAANPPCKTFDASCKNPANYPDHGPSGQLAAADVGGSAEQTRSEPWPLDVASCYHKGSYLAGYAHGLEEGKATRALETKVLEWVSQAFPDGMPACGGYVDMSEKWVCATCGESLTYSAPDTHFLSADHKPNCAGSSDFHFAVRVDKDWKDE